MKEKIYKITPNFIQNILITLYNIKAYRVRHGVYYDGFIKERLNNRGLSLLELKEYQKKRYKDFITFVIENSKYYNSTLSDISDATEIENIRSLPIVNKEELRSNIDQVSVQGKEKMVELQTGGTTGKSLVVRNFPKNDQERYSFLDDFRSRFGYSLGKKTAWFSGKSILTKRDLRKNRFWKTDLKYNVRYYSTFHIKEEYLKYYVENLIEFEPEFLSGFPSSIRDIAQYGLNNNYSFPENKVKAIFTTAETLTEEIREIIESFFKAKIYNQYASSEGAPFIFECKNGNLHLELQSGVFEVLDENDQPSESGRLIVTSFFTEGTPLIRYDIGDSLILEKENKICGCGNNNPLVKSILGRIDDYVYSPEIGKINLGNISNTLKGTYGIRSFQVVQDSLDELNIYLVVDTSTYNRNIEKVFIQNWIERVGKQMQIKLHQVNDIPNESSGKFRIVKNNIKHLIED